jgi:uncharacterized phage protein gp47/JayE
LTKDEVLTALLNAIPDTYDKSVGSFIYDGLVPVAEQIADMDTSISGVQDKLSIENLTGDELESRVNERTGITRKAATYAAGTVTVTGTGTINTGDLFETAAGTQFQSTETKSITTSGTVNIQAVEAGSAGNVAAGTITLFPVTLTGFTAVTNSDPTTGGFEEESDADLLQRYYDYVRTPATSGNKNDYLIWAKSVSGVGDARIIPLWNGNNTVKVVIINSDKQPGDSTLVAAVQDYIDPGITGLGDGIAPIGAFATVESATGVNIDVVATIVLSTGYDLATVTSNIQDALTSFLQSIAFQQSIVSYAKVGETILSSEGVEDYSGLTINGGTTNVPIGTEEVAVLGTTTITT